MNKQRITTKQLALCSVLLTLMLVLGWVESLFPPLMGVPGIKLGLSNGVLIFAVYMLSLPTAWVLMLLGLGYMVIAGSLAGTTGRVPGNGSVQAIGEVLFTKYLLPFELASVLLLVAMIGAVVLARKPQKP